VQEKRKREEDLTKRQLAPMRDDARLRINANLIPFAETSATGFIAQN